LGAPCVVHLSQVWVGEAGCIEIKAHGYCGISFALQWCHQGADIYFLNFQ